MSTTCNPAVALDYSGGEATTGTLFAIDFDMTSRGASVQFLSQYPHEEECATARSDEIPLPAGTHARISP